MTRIIRIALMTALCAAVVALAGCGPVSEKKIEPQVKPPAIATEGTIRIGVDLTTPPFAGADKGRRAGFDVDVAGALADRLGLTVKFVDVKPSDAATALAANTVDAVMSVPLADGAALTQITLAGSYVDDGPGFFIATDSTESVEPTLTLDKITAEKIAVQNESESYWYIRSELDSDSVRTYDSLRVALEALDAGQTQVVAGDAIVGAYIARDFPRVHFAGQLTSARPLAVAVKADNTVLSEAVRAKLDELAANGMLAALRRKWVGDLPALSTGAETSSTVSADESATP